MESTQKIGIHLRSLTSLRFYAAIAVVLYHFHLYLAPLGNALGIAAYGFTGVSFFFILSGFVLTWSHRDQDRAPTFYWKRFSRVWPLHALTTLLAMLVPSLSAPTTVWAALPFVLTLTQSWLPIGYEATFNGVSWSLSCEAFFYLLFPFLVSKLLRRRRMGHFAAVLYGVILVLGICISVSIPTPAANYILGTTPLYRLGEFVLGICLALTVKRGWRPRFTVSHAVGLSAILYFSLLVVSFIGSGNPGSVPVTYADLTMAPGFLAIIAAAANKDLSGQNGALSSRTLVRLGRWSFALYLVHELVIRVAKPLIDGLGLAWAAAAAVLVVGVSVALSGVLHEFVERPVEKWLRSWGVRREPRPAAVPDELTQQQTLAREP